MESDVRRIVREELAEMIVGPVVRVDDFNFNPLSTPPPADNGPHASTPAVPPAAGVDTPHLDDHGLIAAFNAVGQWFDADGNRELLGATPSMVAGVAVQAYVEALRTANDQLQAVADRQAGDL